MHPPQASRLPAPATAAARANLQNSEQLMTERAAWSEQFLREHPQAVGVREALIAATWKEIQMRNALRPFLGKPNSAADVSLSAAAINFLISTTNDFLLQSVFKARDLAIGRKSNLVEMKDVRLAAKSNRILEVVLSDGKFVSSMFDPVKLSTPSADTEPGDYNANVLAAYALELSTLNEIYSNI
eukprot:Gregarina_sp_Poly_1__1198@NODE_1294_length_4466_cov_41_127074_g249_i2_p4_GENE_NODE_1294_length_4466_cov_41_127074_g249_i2NODE_1294_length_4466_cov_41_127074_g249_i2_p4_ORF_typecomplete_len185_score24_86TFIID_20kDa/PF03847_13/0_0015_NODE_1294_length_4466_cov_41_127074_g249_i236384192